MIKMLVVKGGATYDMSELVSKVTWKGRKGAPARTLDVDFIDDDGYNHERTGLSVEEGHQCIFYWNNEELFRGMFMRQKQSDGKMLDAIAYDNGIYLANNKDTFNFTNATVSDIFTDTCNRFGIPFDGVIDTVYRIPELPKPKTTGWDVVADALSLTYQATGIRYYPLIRGDKVSLIERRQNILQWVIETGVNLEDYTFEKSIEKVKTRIKLLSKEGTVLAEAVDYELERKIGVFQDITQINDTMNSGQLTELVNTTLSENNKTSHVLSIGSLGIPQVITGVGVFTIVKSLGISKTYYVEEDSHTFEGREHRMKLKLSLAGDLSIPKQTQSGSPTSEISVGDIVEFSGGFHYVSSTATAAANPTPRKGGPARCTLIARGAPHPYHLIGGTFTNIDGDSNVYGWVDANTVSKI